ncbi:uncharacterized protein BO80DRAFT_100750 [Aspergillus ibericus CBS 121593]|uniref:Uncharacterized protein n=1 Tax=Aspergillus ibericus CBS 121593 TaxID=1448316 RepID=A0A395GZJ6_9EURO|nr:hypothetical protein BO80DRAFT_100750 [Aspergillus ibericus CBS 121593]RAL00509.1 hypothetical protein BO80DRAFT_100750 [Aspergillus ibericus CBS 121593]
MAQAPHGTRKYPYLSSALRGGGSSHFPLLLLLPHYGELRATTTEQSGSLLTNQTNYLLAFPFFSLPSSSSAPLFFPFSSFSPLGPAAAAAATVAVVARFSFSPSCSPFLPPCSLVRPSTLCFVPPSFHSFLTPIVTLTPRSLFPLHSLSLSLSPSPSSPYYLFLSLLLLLLLPSSFFRARPPFPPGHCCDPLASCRLDARKNLKLSLPTDPAESTTPSNTSHRLLSTHPPTSSTTYAAAAARPIVASPSTFID